MKKEAVKTEKEINELINEIQERTGLTQNAIAKRIGYSRSYISQAKNKESEKLFTALKNGFRNELENITLSKNGSEVGISTNKALGKVGISTNEPLEKAIQNLSEADLINARNIERLINLLELKMGKGIQMTEGPGTGTKDYTNQVK
jgi:transcriptional regulator with XRE-family HTH domain